MNLTILGILSAAGGGAAAAAFFLQTLGSVNNDAGRGIAVDSEKNVYIAGQESSASDKLLLVKYGSDGNVIWQRNLGTNDENGLDVKVNSSGDVFVCGFTGNQGAGGRDFLITKYNSSGTIQWQRVLGSATGDQALGVGLDSSSNVYVVGPSADNAAILLAKYNTSGTIQWQRTLAGAGSFYEGAALAVTPSGDVYLSGYADNTGATPAAGMIIAKYNTSGTIQWQRVLGTVFAYGVAIDSSENVYALGSGSASGSVDFVLAKYTSAGTLDWQRNLGGAGQDLPRGVAVDSNNNVYVSGRSNSSGGAGSFDFLFARYNSSGTISWQRRLGGTASDQNAQVTLDSDNTLYLTGITASTSPASNDVFFAKLPSDGSLTGTYALNGINFIYQEAGLTAATPTYTSATSSLNSATSTRTAATSTLTAGTPTLTAHRVDI